MSKHGARDGSTSGHLAPPFDLRSADLEPTERSWAGPDTPKPAIFYIIGLVGGLFGGLLGIGGGSAIAPLLLLFSRLRPAEIAGSTLAIVLVISTVGSGAYASLGRLDIGIAWPIAIGSVGGSMLGALMAKHLSFRMMTGIFLVILPYFAIKEFWPSLAAPDISIGLVALVLLGLTTGFFSGLLGISGASLVVPSLVGFFLIDHHAEQGIAISVALADSTAGVITHAHQGNIRYRLLPYLAVPAAFAAVGGVYLSNWLSGEVLRNLFGMFVVVVWAMMLTRSIKGSARSQATSPVSYEVGGEKQVTSPLSSNKSGDWASLLLRNGWVNAARSFMPTGGRMNTQSIMNALLVFVPLTIAGELFHLGPVIVFTCSAVSCVPLSYWLGRATGDLGDRLGPVAGGLLNATFGNAAEFIISVMALNQGLFLIVRTSLIGSILGQLLLVLGTSLLAAGLRYRTLGFSQPLVQINFTLMAIALVAIGLPSVLLMTASETAGAGPSYLAPVLSAMLLIIYGFAVVFSLSRQPDDDHSSGSRWTPLRALLVLGVSTGGIVLISEFLVSSILPFVEETGISEVFIGLIFIPLFSNVVDHLVAISTALKNRMDLSLTISVGSATQVACMMLPAIVLTSHVMGQSLGLIFTPVELMSLAAGLLLMSPVLLDGKSNWLEGAELLTCYMILALILWGM